MSTERFLQASAGIYRNGPGFHRWNFEINWTHLVAVQLKRKKRIKLEDCCISVVTSLLLEIQFFGFSVKYQYPFKFLGNPGHLIVAFLMQYLNWTSYWKRQLRSDTCLPNPALAELVQATQLHQVQENSQLKTLQVVLKISRKNFCSFQKIVLKQSR